MNGEVVIAETEPGPLEGVRVLELASWVAAPSACSVLAELGAEVVKIEPPGTGDPYRVLSSIGGRDQRLPGGRSLGYDLMNRSKLGLALDLRDCRGVTVLHRLVAVSDVLVTNMTRGRAERLNADYATLEPLNRRLVYMRLSAWGDRGTRCEDAGLDSMMQGPTGLMWAANPADAEQPTRIAGNVVDSSASMLVTTAVLAALRARDRDGRGQEVSTSLLASGLFLQRANVGGALWTGQDYPRNARAETSNPLGTYYRCGDDRWITLQNPSFERAWPVFARVVGFDERIPEPVDRPALVGRLDAVFGERDRDEWCDRLAGTGVGYAPVRTIPEIGDEEQVTANGYVVEGDHPTLGAVRDLGHAIEFMRTPSRVLGPAPLLGEHTDDVLVRICGMTEDEVARLRAEAVVA